MLKRYLLLIVLLCMSLSAAWAERVPPQTVRIHYNRNLGDYSGWGAHVWGEYVDLPKKVTWDRPLAPTGVDEFGVYFDVPVYAGAKELSFILHKGDHKNTPQDMKVVLKEHGSQVWILEDDQNIYTAPPRFMLPTPTEAPSSSQDAKIRERELTALRTENIRLKQEVLERSQRVAGIQAEMEGRLSSEVMNRMRAEMEAKLREDISMRLKADTEARVNEWKARFESSQEGFNAQLQTLIAGKKKLQNYMEAAVLGMALLLMGLMLAIGWAIRNRYQLRGVGVSLEQQTQLLVDHSATMRMLQEEEFELREHLREAQQRFDIAFGHAADLMLLVAVELGDAFRVAAVNRAYLSATGYSKDDVQGRRFEEFYDQELARNLLLAKFREAARGHESLQFTERVEFKKGLMVLDTVVTPVFAEGRYCTHLVVAARPKARRSLPQEAAQTNADALTGLPNRTVFIQNINFALAKVNRVKQPFVVMVLNVDRLRMVNEGLGQETGDLILQAMSQRLRGILRENDVVARLHGDEFSVLIDELTESRAANDIAQKIVAGLSRPYIVDGRECHLTVSIGLVIYPNDGTDAQTLLKNADVALKKAKTSGGNTFQMFAPQFDHHNLERLALESSLKHAVERLEMHVYYQPLVDCKTMRIVGTEALLRWIHPDMGLVMPQQFLTMAEDSNLILPLGRWVLDTVCKQRRAWTDMGVAPFPVVVNISPRQFGQHSFVHDVKQILDANRFDPAQLVLDITEQAILHNPPHSVQVLEELHRMGVRIAIDDFGTGYSAITSLTRFPISIVKIDRTFISELSSHGDAREIVQSMIATAQSLKLTVVAEGVEQEEQLTVLRECGCDLMQGHFFSKPVLAADILALVPQSQRIALH